MAAVVGMLALTALSATLEVVIEGSVGMLLAHINVLDNKSTRVLTNIGYYVTLPSMNLYRLASGVSLEMMKTVWIVTLYSFIFITISFVLGRIAFIRRLWGSRIKSNVEQTMYVFSVTFNNAVSLPFVFVGALCLSGSKLFADPQLAVSQAVAFISIYSIANASVFWTYGLSTLKKLAAEKSLEESQHHETVVTPDTKSSDELVPETDNNTEITIQDDIMSVDGLNTPESPPPPFSFKQFAKEKLVVVKNALVSGIKSLLTPPMIALALGMTIACISPVKNFLVISPPPIISSIMHVAKLFSDATFALSMIVLGSNLYTTFMSSKNNDSDEKKVRRRGFNKYLCFVCDRFIRYNDPIALFVAVAIKLLVMPLVGIGVVVGSVQLGILARGESVLLLVLLVEASTPSAINLNNLANLADGIGQDQVCEILLFMYACCPISLSLYATAFLYLIEALAV